jgi:O-antigen/teichoic acid export membrane protein
MALGAMTQSQRIAKNMLAGGLSTALGGLLQLFAILLVARHVSVGEFGIYSFILAFALLLQRLSDLGVSNILMRDMAVEPRRIPRVLGAALSLAWLVTIVLTLLMLGSIHFLPFDRDIELLTVIMGVGGASQFQCGLYGATLRSQEDNELYALGFVLHKAILVAMVAAVFALGFGLRAVVFSHLIANLLQWWFYRWLVIKRYARPILRVEPALWKYLLVNSVPVGASGVLRILAEQADILILASMTNPRTMGLFSGPSKLAAGLRFVPQAMMVALYPLYARAAGAANARDEFGEAYERGLKGFLLLAFPAALIFLLCPRPLAVGLLGERYLAAIPAVRLLAIGVFLLFIASPFPFLITALDRQRCLLISSAAALAIRVALDIVLTPVWGFLAPCLALAVSDSVLLAMWINCVWRAGFAAPLGELAWRPCVAASFMAAILYALHPQSVILLLSDTLLATAGYLGALVMLGAFSRDELALFREGLGFVHPFLNQWFRQLEKKPS